MKKADKKNDHAASKARNMEDEDESLMSTEAREEYGLTREMMTSLLADGTLGYEQDALDKRIKWVKRSDLEKLIDKSRKQQRVVGRLRAKDTQKESKH